MQSLEFEHFSYEDRLALRKIAQRAIRKNRVTQKLQKIIASFDNRGYQESAPRQKMRNFSYQSLHSASYQFIIVCTAETIDLHQEKQKWRSLLLLPMAAMHLESGFVGPSTKSTVACISAC